MADETPNEIAQNVFKHNLKASENTRRLFSEVPQDEAEQVILDEFNRLMGSVEDAQRAEDAAMLLQRLAQGLESQRLLEAVIQEAENNDLLEMEQQQGQ